METLEPINLEESTHLIYIDRDSTSHGAIKEHLESNNFVKETALSGFETWNIMDSFRPELILIEDRTFMEAPF
ncbi:MAG TPA: hypothetical protein VM050_00900 [Patescibacteria group bacterium]|nr:hypothetical protein [Patescibacteria group bacterium]